MKPRGGRAVIEQCAPQVVETDDPKTALQRRLGFFPTPPWATRAGAELLLRLDPEARVIREPACGEMHMADVLAESFEAVLATDVHPHRADVAVRDWLDDAAWPDEPDCDWVFTNPPFSIADQFVIRGLKRARRGVAILVRLAFIETPGRYDLFAGSDPLTLLAPFSERAPMTLGKWKPDASTATAYAWLFWKKGAAPMPPAFIGPGTKARLWLPDDAERFGFKEPMPLFEGLA